MRHVLGVLLAAAVVLVLFFVAGWGVARITALHPAGLTGAGGLAALTAVLVTGLLVGVLLVMPSISPLGAGLPGLLLLGWSAWLVVNARQATRLVPLQGHAYAAGFASLLVTGVLAFAGAIMVIPLFVPSRWRAGGDAAFVDLDEPPTEYGLIR
jgi:hypothetical protein